LNFCLSLFVSLVLFISSAGCEEKGPRVTPPPSRSGESVTVEIEGEAVTSPEAPPLLRTESLLSPSSPDEWDPFAWMEEFRKEMDRFFERSRSRGRPDELESFESAWSPRVDIYEDDSSVVVRVDLPGMEKEAIDVTVRGNILTLKGEREEEKEIREKNYRSLERSFGSFQRSITLPPIADTDHPETSYQNGVLVIRFPKKEAPAEKRIMLI